MGATSRNAVDPALRITLSMFGCTAALLAAAVLCITRWKACLVALAAAEALFAAYYWLIKVPQLNAQPSVHAPRTDNPDHNTAEFLRCAGRTVEDVHVFLGQWCMGGTMDTIGRDDALELMSYAFWYKTRQQMEAAGQLSKAEQLLDSLEQLFSIKFKPGSNPSCRFMDHLRQDVPHTYKPLTFYLVMEALAALAHSLLTLMGFQCSLAQGIPVYTINLPGCPTPRGCAAFMSMFITLFSYSSSNNNNKSNNSSSSVQEVSQEHQKQPPANAAYHQQQQQQQQRGPSAAPSTASSTPVVFLHGVGLGLLGYLPMVTKLAATGRPLLVPLSKHVSMRLTRTIPTVDQVACAVRAALASAGFKRAAVVGHSYGSTVASRLVQEHPGVVEALVLLDPVCFHMYLPNLLTTFLYTRTFNSGHALLDGVMRCVSTEVHCTAAFSRNFFWTRINLWAADLPPRTLVALSGKDVLVNAPLVKGWLLEETGAQVLYDPDMPHAGCLLDSDWQDTILQHLEQLLQDSSTGAAAGAVAGVGSKGAGSKGLVCRAKGAAAAAAGVFKADPSHPDHDHHPEQGQAPPLLINAGLLATWSGVMATAITAGCPADPQGVLQLPAMAPQEQAGWQAALQLMQPSIPAATVTWESAQALLLLADKYDMPGITSQVDAFLCSTGPYAPPADTLVPSQPMARPNAAVSSDRTPAQVTTTLSSSGRAGGAAGRSGVTSTGGAGDVNRWSANTMELLAARRQVLRGAMAAVGVATAGGSRGDRGGLSAASAGASRISSAGTTTSSRRAQQGALGVDAAAGGGGSSSVCSRGLGILLESNLFRKLQRDVVQRGCRAANQEAWGWLALLGRCGLEAAAQVCIGFIQVYGLEGPSAECVAAVQPGHMHAVLAALFAERGGRGLREGGTGRGAAGAGLGREEGVEEAVWRRLHLA